MNEEIIQKILKYRHECLKDPRNDWSKEKIMIRSYEQWAVTELLLYISDNPFKDAISLVDKFIIKMEIFLYASPINSKPEIIFETASRVSQDIQKYLELN